MMRHSFAIKHLIATATLLFLATGCSRPPTYGGASTGSYGNADRRTTTCVVTQLDAERNILFAIAWTAEHGGGSAAQSGENLLTAIHDHPVHPNPAKRALYALQPDHTLREIPLN